MKILVTGASGFLGTHLCQRLLNDGHDVYALVRSPAKFTDVSPSSRLHIVQGDLDHADLSWMTLLPDDLDSCVHTAGIVHSYITDHFYKTNAQGTAHLITNLKKRFQQLHFVLISSLAAAGPSMGPVVRSESDLDVPVSIYGRSKKKAEEHLQELAPETWTLSIIRPPMVIGPRDAAVLDIFKMVRGRIIVLPGLNSKSKLYSFVCVFDLVETIVKLTEMKKEGTFYSSHPEHVSFQQLILEIKKQTQTSFIMHLPLPLFLVKSAAFILSKLYHFRPHNLRLTPDKVFELAATNWTCDSKKSMKELDQAYKYNLSKTIAITLEDYKKRQWIN